MLQYFQGLGNSIAYPPFKRLMHGIFWSFTGNFLSQFISLVIMVILARYWGKDGYGQFGIITATTLFFSEFAGIGLGITSTKYISQFVDRDKKLVGNIIGSTLVIGSISALLFSAGFFILSPYISTYYLNIPQLGFELKISSLLLLFTTINGAMTSILLGFEKFKEITVANLVRSLVAVPVILLGVYYLGLTGAIYALALLSLIQLCLLWNYILKTVKKFEIEINYVLKKTVIQKIIKFGVTIFLTNIIVSFTLWLSNVIIVNQPAGIGEVGIINAANQWRGILTFLPAVIIQVLLPLLSANQEETKRADYNKILAISLNIVILIIFPLCSLLMLFTPTLISFYGSTYKNSELALMGIFFSAMLSGILSLFGPVLQSKEKLWTAFLFNLLWSIILIVLILLFGKRFGASSYTFGSAFGYIFSLLLLYNSFIKKQFPEDSNIRIIVAILNSLIITSLCILNLYHHTLTLTIFIVLAILISTYFTLDAKFRLGIKGIIMQLVGRNK